MNWKPSKMIPIHPLLILADKNNKKGYDPPNKVAVHLIITVQKQIANKQIIFFLLSLSLLFLPPFL